MPREYLGDLASEILDVATDAVAPDITGVPAPSKVFVSFGDPIADLGACCEGTGGGQLTVHLGRPQGGVPLEFRPLSKQAPCNVETRAFYTVTLQRCYPAIDTTQKDFAPTEEALNAASLLHLTDLWCLVVGLRQWCREDECAARRIVQTAQLVPQGGCAGWQVVLDVQANDGGPGVGS